MELSWNEFPMIQHMQFIIFDHENEPIFRLAKQAEKLGLGLQLRELRSRTFEQSVSCSRSAARALAQQRVAASARARRRKYVLPLGTPGDASLTDQVNCGRGYAITATTTPPIRPAPHNHSRAPPRGHAWLTIGAHGEC